MTDNAQGDDDSEAFADGLIDANRNTDTTVSTDELFELLASPGNRFVLTYLLQVDGPVEYAHLIEYVIERAEPPDGMTEGKFRGRVAATLVNERLPELESAGMVEVDSSAQLVTPTIAVNAARPHLALALSDLPPPTTGE